MARILLAPLALVVLLLSASPASATLITFVLDTEFSGGDVPSGFPTVTLDDGGGSGLVTLTVTTNLSGSEFLDDIYLNYGGASALTTSAFTYVSGAQANTISVGSDAFKADGDGFFDILIDYPPPPGNMKFGPGETSVYTITLAGLTANDFFFSSAPGGGNGTFFAAGHVQGIGADGQGSGWVGDNTGPGTPGPGPGPGGGGVPEPSSLIMLGFGLVLAARQLRRR